MHMDLRKNAERFTGFAQLYDRARPAAPAYPVHVLQMYLGRVPDLVVDLGSGTGLSTVAWAGNCRAVVGVEPSGDMLEVARARRNACVSFVQAFAHETGLPEACADVVICSQSFHWMEPVTTLKEVNRILKPNGVFAAMDCDWPPVMNWRAEKAYAELYSRIKRLEEELPEVRDSFVRYSKDQHLERLRQSGYFRYCRELLFANTELCTAERLVALLLSQGGLQTVLKKRPDAIAGEIGAFRAVLRNLYGDAQFTIDFCYRMRVGVR